MLQGRHGFDAHQVHRHVDCIAGHCHHRNQIAAQELVVRHRFQAASTPPPLLQKSAEQEKHIVLLAVLVAWQYRKVHAAFDGAQRRLTKKLETRYHEAWPWG